MKRQKKTLTNKLRENPYMFATIVLSLLVLFLILYPYFEKNEIDLCNVISGTPAWIVDGKVLGYGYKGNLSVDGLINNQIEFYYRSGCGFCEKQINDFDDWNKYKLSGLVSECK
ncbi:MAG: hypothetical protein ACTSQG_10940 [Promethearchaeota archaeon]